MYDLCGLFITLLVIFVFGRSRILYPLLCDAFDVRTTHVIQCKETREKIGNKSVVFNVHPVSLLSILIR